MDIDYNPVTGQSVYYYTAPDGRSVIFGSGHVERLLNASAIEVGSVG